MLRIFFEFVSFSVPNHCLFLRHSVSCSLITLPLVDEQSVVMSMFVCMSLCEHIFWTMRSSLHQMFFLHITYGCLKQWRLRLLHAVLQSSSSSSETFLQYAKYFQFYGQRHILHNGPYGGMSIPLQQCCCSVQLQQCSDVILVVSCPRW